MDFSPNRGFFLPLQIWQGYFFNVSVGTPHTPDLEGQQPAPPDLPERRFQGYFLQRLKG